MAGDVYVRINLKKHEKFERRGADLLHFMEISLLEAITGVTTKITILDGREFVVATAPG
jgi:DnaJ family protein A protein 2